MLIQESYINATKGYRFGDSDQYESFTDDIKTLFQSLQREYGRCVSRVYVDREGQTQPIAVGWVFQKRMQYEDARNNHQESYYVREVWIMLFDEQDTITRQHHYHMIK